ncbi:hypothetical protein CRENBAI_000924 [Crenichthys baileyi]|uniref:Fibronectin type-III domain-containing protein n=1 Tax=Crenichthys baileyi TaxID=28760 RepID=A0AAV9R889_9TELE
MRSNAMWYNATNKKASWSACEAPSSPQCFRQNEGMTVYVCEWDFSTNETDVAFDLYFNDTFGIKTKFGNIKENRTELNEEVLIVGFKVDIWVEAHAGSSICTSNITSGILSDTVKYEAPQNITVSWLGKNLSLSWQSDFPSLAEVLLRKDGDQTESWEKRIMNTTNEASTEKLVIVNLQKKTAYQVQIRHRSNQAKTSLWSNWSPAVIVPAELEDRPKVSSTTTLLNDTRQVTLTWETHSAAVRGLTYTVNVTQSSLKCPCKRKSHSTRANSYTVYVSHSAVNITVIARNAAGHSPPAVLHVPVAYAADLKTCDKTLLDEKLKAKTCLEFYELQDADLIPERVWYLTGKKRKKERKKIKKDMKNYTRYLYFEHRCHDGKPQTVKMCLYYKRQGVPSREPQNFITVSYTHNSANLSWTEIPYADLNGVLTHYKLCTVKSLQFEPQECVNISASATKHCLKDLTPGTKYNVSLAGVTQAGEGPVATQVCTIILKRIKSKVFPPVPKPVIPDFSCRQPEGEEMWERKEEVHELTLHQPISEEATVLQGEWDDGIERKVEKDGSCLERSDDESSSLASADVTLRKPDLKDLEQVETELAMLIYRNGLVFDVKSESL